MSGRSMGFAIKSLGARRPVHSPISSCEVARGHHQNGNRLGLFVLPQQLADEPRHSRTGMRTSSRIKSTWWARALFNAFFAVGGHEDERGFGARTVRQIRPHGRVVINDEDCLMFQIPHPLSATANRMLLSRVADKQFRKRDISYPAWIENHVTSDPHELGDAFELANDHQAITAVQERGFGAREVRPRRGRSRDDGV